MGLEDGFNRVFLLIPNTDYSFMKINMKKDETGNENETRKMKSKPTLCLPFKNRLNEAEKNALGRETKRFKYFYNNS